jgi:aromatic-amino-acid transaminase
MFEKITAGAPDPILSLLGLYRQDDFAEKVNVAVGIYYNEQGKLENLAAVAKAEAIVTKQNAPKTYLNITGEASYLNAVKELIFQEKAKSEPDNILSMQAPGGTGALRIAAEFFKRFFPESSLWVSDPTWPIHLDIFGAQNLDVKSYPYRDVATNGLNLAGMLDTVKAAKAQDILLVHGCCHNPTGIDPTKDEWQQIAELAKAKDMIVLIDFAYQGFGDGVKEDVACVAQFIDAGCPVFVASSFSKNIGLYNQRIGALSVHSHEGAAVLENVRSQCAKIIRGLYSNPPAHGSQIVGTIFSQPELKQMWLEELEQMRMRLVNIRQSLCDELKAYDIDAEYVTKQRGMFSLLNVTPEQVQQLQQQHHVYMLKSGRINVAGLTPANVGYFAKALAAVMK